MLWLRPKSIGAYRIVEPIAEGGMASIHRAIDSSQNLEVALKVLKPNGVTLVDHLQKLSAPWEGEIGVQFDHPHVVNTYEYGAWRDTYFVAMELLDWPSLKDLITAQSPLVTANRYEIAYQIAQGLAHIHERGFIHRDLSPKNVLIDRRGIPKLIDFGLTIPVDMASQSRDKRSGTASYMAPEQVRGKAFDERCDIYSLGVTMYEVLTGRHPFPSGTKEGKKAGHLNIEARPLCEHDPTIAEPVGALVLQAMAKAAEDRFTSMAVLVEAIRARFPAEATGGASAEQGRRETRRFARIEDRCFVRIRSRRGWLFRRELRTVTKDISLGGMCCVPLREPLKQGERIELGLLLRGDKSALSISGEVAWCRQSQGEGKCEIGIAFGRISMTVRERLRKYVLAHQPEAES